VRLRDQTTPSPLEAVVGVAGQPARALGQQLLHLVSTDEVVLLIVEHRRQDVEVGEQLGQGRRRAHGHRVVLALAPFRELLVQRVADGLDRVAQRLEYGTQEPPPRTGSTSMRADSGIGVAASSGRSWQRPCRVDSKTCAMATLRKDVAA
jgi:hypothetical protein